MKPKHLADIFEFTESECAGKTDAEIIAMLKQTRKEQSATTSAQLMAAGLPDPDDISVESALALPYPFRSPDWCWQ